MLLLCGDLVLERLSSPHTQDNDMGGSELEHAVILGQDPLPALWGPPVGFLWHLTGRAYMERRVDISIWNGEDRLAFVLHQALCQQNSPRQLKGSGSLLDAAPGEFHPQPHNLHLLSLSTLERWPKPLVRLPFPPSSLAPLPAS